MHHAGVAATSSRLPHANRADRADHWECPALPCTLPCARRLMLGCASLPGYIASWARVPYVRAL